MFSSIFISVLFCVFVSSTIRMNICIATSKIIIVIFFALFSVYLLIHILRIIIGLLVVKAIDIDLLISVPKNQKKASCEVKSIKNMIFVWNTRGVGIYFVLLTKFCKLNECLKTMNQRHKMLMWLSTYEP